MRDLLTKEGLEWIVEAIINRAQETVDDYAGKESDFSKGKMQAYYEILDMIKSRIIIRDGEPNEYGLGFRLESLEAELKRSPN